MTVKTTLMRGSVEARLREIESEGRIATLEMTEPYASMPGEAGVVPSCGLVFRVNRPA